MNINILLVLGMSIIIGKSDYPHMNVSIFSGHFKQIII